MQKLQMQKRGGTGKSTNPFWVQRQLARGGLLNKPFLIVRLANSSRKGTFCCGEKISTITIQPRLRHITLLIYFNLLAFVISTNSLLSNKPSVKVKLKKYLSHSHYYSQRLVPVPVKPLVHKYHKCPDLLALFFYILVNLLLFVYYKFVI